MSFVCFANGLFRQRRLPADSKEHEHTFADAIKQPGEDRIDKDCFVLFVCLFACLLVCFFCCCLFQENHKISDMIYAQKWLRIFSQAHIVTSFYAFKCFSTLSSGCN